MAWADFPALYIRPVRHGAIPIGDPHRVRLGIEYISLEFAHQRALPGGVRLVQHLFVERHLVWIFEHICRAGRRCGSAARSSAPRRPPLSATFSLRRAIARCWARSRRSAAARPWWRPAARPARRCRRLYARRLLWTERVCRA